MDLLEQALKIAERFGAAAPLVGVLFWLYWQERTERRELAKEVLTLSKDAVEAEKDMTRAVELLTAKVTR